MSGGHIIRRSGRKPAVRIYVGRDAVSGMKRYRTVTVEELGVRREHEMVARARQELGLDLGGKGERHTVKQMLDRWYAQCSDDWSPRTAMDTRKWIEGVLRPLHELDAARCSTEQIDDFYLALRDHG